MGNDDFLTDDYVADLLAKDAKDCSLKYSAMGMEAFSSSSKKPANAPKPNTRFLRNVIKSTDNHNKNLLAKEEAESRARLQDLERAEEVKRLKTNPNTGDIRRRQMGDIHAILGGKRPRKSKDDVASRDKPEASGAQSRRRGEKKTSLRDNDDLFSSRNKRTSHGRLADDHDERDQSRKSHSRRSRRHSASDDEDRSERRERKRQDEDHSRNCRRRRSRSPDRKGHRHRHRSPVRRRRSPSASSAHDDSDPADDLIGPQPAPKPRGRGRLAGSSGIDQRFADNYDPSKDTEMEDDQPEGGSWDDEVEAFRDRQKLKQVQEARLREAGFGEDVIKKTEKGSQRPEADVHWSGAGEKREWDRGKQ